MAREYKKYKDYTKQERDRYIRLGERPFKTSKTTNIRPKDTLKGTTGTTINTGAERKPGGDTKGGSNLAKNLRPAPPPKFSRIQYPNAAGNLKDSKAAFAITAKEQKLIQEGKMKQDPKTGKPIYPKEKKKVLSEAISPAIARVLANKKPPKAMRITKIEPPKTKVPVRPRKIKPPKIKLPPPQKKITRIARPDIKTIQKANQKIKPSKINLPPPPKKPTKIVKPKIKIPKVKKLEAPKIKQPKIKAPVKPTKIVKPKIKIPKVPEKIKQPKIKVPKKLKIDIKNFKNNNPRTPGESNRAWANRALLALPYLKTLGKGALGAFFVAMGFGQQTAIADDPEGARKKVEAQKRKAEAQKRKAEAQKRKEVGSSMDYKHGGKIARYNTGTQGKTIRARINRGRIKDTSNGNDFVQNLYDN